MAGVAQDEVRKLSERLKFGFRQAIKNGHVLGNDRLWGYDKSGCVLTVNEAEAQVVRRIFDLYANQQLGIRRISQILFDEGFTSRQGNAFNVLTIRHILCNPKYKGWYCGSKSETVDYRSKRKVFLDESEWVMYPDPSVLAIVDSRAVWQLSLCCLENARDILLALEAEYRSLYARNLTLARLGEAVILPLCPDKGPCMTYDLTRAASTYLDGDIEQLRRMR